MMMTMMITVRSMVASKCDNDKLAMGASKDDDDNDDDSEEHGGK